MASLVVLLILSGYYVTAIDKAKKESVLKELMFKISHVRHMPYTVGPSLLPDDMTFPIQ